MITMFHQIQTDMRRLFPRISESTDISCGEPGCILNIDLMSYRRVISPQNWMVHDFYKKWMSRGPGKCAQEFLLCVFLSDFVNMCDGCAIGDEDPLRIHMIFFSLSP